MLLNQDRPDFEDALLHANYLEELNSLQVELVQLQNWVIEKNQRVLIIIEGGEFAGKGLLIRTFTEKINPRSSRIVALPKPHESEKFKWYFRRYVHQLPHPGEMVFFDRSWYNRAVVEPVNGFCTKKQYERFMHDVIHFENMLYNDGIIIFKIFLAITKSTQKKRIDDLLKNPLRRWELSEVDRNAQTNWEKYEYFQKLMFDTTSTSEFPWKIIDSNNIKEAQIEAIKYILKKMPGRVKDRVPK